MPSDRTAMHVRPEPVYVLKAEPFRVLGQIDEENPLAGAIDHDCPNRAVVEHDQLLVGCGVADGAVAASRDELNLVQGCERLGVQAAETKLLGDDCAIQPPQERLVCRHGQSELDSPGWDLVPQLREGKMPCKAMMKLSTRNGWRLS